MGFFDSLRNVLSRRPSRPEAWLPVHVEDAPPLKSEHDLALHLLDQPAVAQLFEGQGADIGTIRGQVELGRAAVTRESWESLHLVVQQPNSAHADRHVDLLLKLLSLGTDEIRAAFTTPGLKPGDIAFALAHGRPETQLRAEWPAAGTARSVEIVNDDYSPMECVYPALERELDMANADATVLMVRIHHAGAFRVAPPPPLDAESFCVRANAAWRQAGLALYCRPSTQAPDA